MRGLAILLLFNLAGVALHEWAHVPLPGNVLGFGLLTLAMFAGVIKLAWVEEPAELLIRHLSLFFSPSIVMAAALLPVISQQWAAIAIGIIGSTAATMFAAGWTVQLMAPKEKP